MEMRLDSTRSPEHQYWWRIALELKLRRCSGEAFQDFFSTVMEKLHGTDFVRVRAFGRRGDKGCDGYRTSTGEVFQCYGALNGDGSKVDYLVEKVESDFKKASDGLSIMKEWHMVHNLVDGLPIEGIETIEELKTANPDLTFGYIGKEGFEQRIFSLHPDQIDDLLGMSAMSRETQELQVSELRELVIMVTEAADSMEYNVATIKPVPPDKLEFNELPGHWRAFIANGWQNTHLVQSYFDKHHDPRIGETVAQILRVRYQYLKSQNLKPGAIMASLHEFVAGIGNVSIQRQVATQALLAHFFESCDIFEDEPAAVSQ